MLKSQRLQLEQSKCRERLGEINKLEGEALTEEILEERSKLSDAYTTRESELRAALIVEDSDEGKVRENRRP